MMIRESLLALAIGLTPFGALAQGFVYESGPMGTPPAMSYPSATPYPYGGYSAPQQTYTMPAPPPLPALPRYGQSYVPEPPQFSGRSTIPDPPAPYGDDD